MGRPARGWCLRAGRGFDAEVGQGESPSRTLPLVSDAEELGGEATDDGDGGEEHEHVLDADAGDDESDQDGAEGGSGAEPGAAEPGADGAEPGRVELGGIQVKGERDGLQVGVGDSGADQDLDRGGGPEQSQCDEGTTASRKATNYHDPVQQLIGLDDITAAASRIGGHVLRTPTIQSPGLRSHLGVPVQLKLELLQYTGSFKPRGAFNKMLSLSDQERSVGVVAVSGGNHGMAVAEVAGLLGITAVVVMPDYARRRPLPGLGWPARMSG